MVWAPFLPKVAKVVLAALTALVVMGVVAAGLPRALGLSSEALGQRLVLAQASAQPLPGDEVLFADDNGSIGIYRVLGLQRSGNRQTLILADEDGRPLPTPVSVSGEVLVVRTTIPLLGYGHRLMDGWGGRGLALLVLAGALVWLYRRVVEAAAPASAPSLLAMALARQGARQGRESLAALAAALRQRLTDLSSRSQRRQEEEMATRKSRSEAERGRRGRRPREDEGQAPGLEPREQLEAVLTPNPQAIANSEGPSDVLEVWPPVQPLATLTEEGAETAATPALAEDSQGRPEGEDGQEESPLDSDLMAIFQKVASQVRERTLASEVEDVPLPELLEELRAVRQRLRPSKGHALLRASLVGQGPGG